MARAVEPFANISAQELLKNTPRLFGWVRKEDVAGLRSVVKVLDWPWRYMILTTGCLYLYKTADDQNFSEAIPLTSFRVCDAPEKSKYTWMFKLIHESLGGKTLFFAVDSDFDLKKWKDAITESKIKYCSNTTQGDEADGYSTIRDKVSQTPASPLHAQSNKPRPPAPLPSVKRPYSVPSLPDPGIGSNVSRNTLPLPPRPQPSASTDYSKSKPLPRPPCDQKPRPLTMGAFSRSRTESSSHATPPQGFGDVLSQLQGVTLNRSPDPKGPASSSTLSSRDCSAAPGKFKKALWDAATVHQDSIVQDFDDDPLERTTSSSTGPTSILKASSKPRLKKPATLFQQRPLRRTYTNLSVLSTSSASGSPSKKLQTQRTKELQDATLEGLSETDTEESDAEPVQPKPVQPERRRSVQISDVKEVREPAGLPISIPRARTRRVSVVSNMSKLSASSFFMQENQSTGYLGHFLRDPESSYAAYLFANLWNYFIAVTVLLSLSQTTKTPLINGMAVGIAEAVIEFIFLVECVAEVVVEVQMQRFDFMKHMYTVIDVLAVAPLPVRAATGFVQPSLAEEPWAHYTLVCLVPLLRLLKLIRRFGQIQLLAHVFRTTGDALKFLLFLVSIIVLLFSTLLYILEPDHIVDSMFTAMWVSTVTVTTVGYGDITPITLSGKMLMGSLCFFSSLFMAMPISVLGNAMSHAWTDRNRILLMARTRQRLKRHGFQAADLPRLFRQYDGNQTGDLSMDEFCDMIVKMKVGMGPREAEELFELFDVDGSGGIDDKEFMKALFPDDYRRIFLRSESIRRITTTDSSRTSPASPN